MCNIGASIADIPVHLTHDANVLVAVQQRVLLVVVLRTAAGAGASGVGGFVGLEAGICENDDKALRVFVGGGDGDVLLSDELGEGRRRQGLGPLEEGNHVSSVDGCRWKMLKVMRDAKAVGKARNVEDDEAVKL